VVWDALLPEESKRTWIQSVTPYVMAATPGGKEAVVEMAPDDLREVFAKIELTLLTAGDQGMFARMARLADPSPLRPRSCSPTSRPRQRCPGACHRARSSRSYARSARGSMTR